MHDTKRLTFLAVNLLTTTGFICALAAIILALKEEFALSFAMALAGFICDSLDGPLARRMGVAARFGAIYDAVVDTMLYLVYPAVSWYVFFDFHDGLALIVLLFFLFSGIFRLVRTADKGVLLKGERSYFIGVPVVISLPLLAVSFAITHNNPDIDTAYLYGLLPLFSLFMISRIPFPKPTGKHLHILLFVTLIIALLILVL